MKTENLLLSSLVGLGLAVATSADAAPKWAKKGDTIVKCKGVAKKGKNDCGANGHSCAGMAETDGDAHEWVAVPKGTCDKIVGGSTTKMDKPMMDKDAK